MDRATCEDGTTTFCVLVALVERTFSKCNILLFCLFKSEEVIDVSILLNTIYIKKLSLDNELAKLGNNAQIEHCTSLFRLL